MKRLLIWVPVILFPLITSTATLDPALLPRFILFAGWLLLLSLSLLWKPLSTGGFSRLTGLGFLLYLLYFCISGISLFLYRANLPDGLFSWASLFLAGAGPLLLFFMLRGEKDLRDEFLRATVILGIFSALIGIYQFTRVSLGSGLTHETTYLIRSTFAHKNIFAEALCLLLPLNLLAYKSLPRWWKGLALFSAGAALFLIVLTLSRSAWLALAGGALVFAVMRTIFPAERGKAGTSPARLIAGGILVVALAVTLYSGFDTAGTFRKQFSSLVNTGYGSARDRLLLWEKTIDLAKERPLTGNGLGSWKTDILREGNTGLKSADNKTFYQRPHNDYLWILSEQGLPALLIYLAWVGLVFYLLFRLLKKTKDEKDRQFYLVLWSGLSIYFILSFFAFPRERIEHMILLSFILGFVFAEYGRKFPPAGRESEKWKLRLGTFLLVFPLFLIFLLGLSRYRSEANTLKAFTARETGNWEEVIRNIDKARGPFYQMDPTTTPLAWYRGLANYNLGRVPEAGRDFREALRICPWHVHALNNLATCYELEGEHEKAVSLYADAVRLSPGFEDAWINLAAVYFNMGKQEQAYMAICQVDTSSAHPNYKNSLLVILGARAALFSQKTADTLVARYVARVIDDPIWTEGMFRKAVMNRIDFTEQMSLDIIWLVKEEEKDTILAKRLQNVLSL